MIGLAYDRFNDGHRRFNLKTWEDALGLAPLLAPPSFRVFLRLVLARHVLFATVDDTILFFIFVGFVRGVIGRKSVGIFLRPHGCFRDGETKSLFKRWLYLFTMRLPGIRIATMVPHFADPRYATVSHTWIYDPQNWDLVSARPDLSRRTELVDELFAYARGRKIIVAIGGLNRFKGFDFLGQIAATGVIKPDTHVILACGPLSPESLEAADAITGLGGVVIDRFITDADIMAFYGIADFVWACYPEVNDQASGIFGRASQLGVPAIVRKGSFNEEQARRMGAAYLAVPFGDALAAAEMIMSAQISRKPPNWELIEGFKAESLARLEALF